jgi:hypothetical protein
MVTLETIIKIECLQCGHEGTISESDLIAYGEKPDAPIAALSRRLICTACGSHSFRAYRTKA